MEVPGHWVPALAAHVLNSFLVVRLLMHWTPLSWRGNLWQISAQPLPGVAAQQQFLPTKLPSRKRYTAIPIVPHPPQPPLPPSPLRIGAGRHMNLPVTSFLNLNLSILLSASQVIVGRICWSPQARFLISCSHYKL